MARYPCKGGACLKFKTPPVRHGNIERHLCKYPPGRQALLPPNRNYRDNYLITKHPPRPLLYAYAYGLTMVPGGGRFLLSEVPLQLVRELQVGRELRRICMCETKEGAYLNSRWAVILQGPFGKKMSFDLGGNIGVYAAQHRQTSLPSVERIRRTTLLHFGSQ